MSADPEDEPQAAATEPRLRITSTSGIPHRDVGDVARSPAWRPGMPIGHNEHWERYLEQIVAQVTASQPQLVLHTGDMVEGRWTEYARPAEGRPYGPVDQEWQQRRAIHRAADVYYPWIANFWSGHDVVWAMGDHEIGDIAANGVIHPNTRKYQGHETFKDSWRRHLGRWNKSRYGVRRGPVGILTLDPFHRWRIGVVPVVSEADRYWLRRRVGEMRANGVRWVIVQCEIPTRDDNNRRGTSALSLRNGEQVDRLLRELGVDLYLTAEFHADTVHTNAGRKPVQIVHGGSQGRASWLNIAVFDNRLDLELWESVGGHTGNARLWAMSNARAWARPFAGQPRLRGSATLWRAGGLTRRTGWLAIEGVRP